MEQIILAFGLGIVLVTDIVLVYVVLKSNKKVTEYENNIRGLEEKLMNYRNDSHQEDQAIERYVQEVDRKVDSRIDKLDARVMMELERFKQNYIKNY